MTKTLLAVALLTSGLIAQAQDLRPEPTANANERVTIAEQGDRTEYTKYYQNGQVKERGYYRNGERHGSYVLFNERGLAVVQRVSRRCLEGGGGRERKDISFLVKTNAVCARSS